MIARLAPLVLVACSSSAQQPSESSSRTATAAPADAASADPWTAKPRDPAAELAVLRSDIEIMCGAAKATGGKTFIEVGPYMAENMKGPFKVELMADVRTRTLDEIIERMRQGMARANVQTCDTVDVLIEHDPRKQP